VRRPRQCPARADRCVLVNVGIIEAGNARQVIPDRASLSIDLRAPGTAEADALIASVTAIAARTIVPGATTTMTGGITRPAFPTSAGRERLLRLAQECGRDLGLTFEGNYTRAGSDGNFTAALGVPTLDGLGTRGDGAHTDHEYVLIADLAPRAALLAGLVTHI